jgi:hypothetical protein
MTTTARPSPPFCRCEACVAQAALVLLKAGRAGPAARLLEDLPEELAAAVRDVFAAGREPPPVECLRRPVKRKGARR